VDWMFSRWCEAVNSFMLCGGHWPGDMDQAPRAMANGVDQSSLTLIKVKEGANRNAAGWCLALPWSLGLWFVQVQLPV
jgi:hypothetical protein